MIVIKLKGGTGNQMFQYAAGRALALRLGSSLSLDLSFLQHTKLGKNVDPRDYGLSVFRIQEQILKRNEIDEIKRKIRFNSKWKLNALNRIVFRYKLPIWKSYSEKNREYNPEFNVLSSNTLLDGYWTNPKYFENFENKIREDFLFRENPDRDNLEILRRIKKKEDTVALHIRRGDFTNIDILGITGMDYYKTAIHKISNELDDPFYFIFSDDLEWVKKELQSIIPIQNLFFVDINSEINSHTNDIRLMAACNHNIIGNSSFAWWGAWLNKNSKKRVIAPKKLFNDQKIDNELQGMIPSEWIRL